MKENIFLGLQPYTENDASRFKGRTEESQELFQLIVRNDFTVCYAESGEGKTSLLNAGVFPLLRENMFFPISITFTNDDYECTPDNFDTIIDRCVKDSIAEYNEHNKGINVEYKLTSSDFANLDCKDELQKELSKHSWWKLRNFSPQAMGLKFTPVFIFDQFEEVFNLPESSVWTKKFFDWLENVSSDCCPDELIETVRKIIGKEAAFPIIKEEKDFKAIFSLRKEFIGELDYWAMQKNFIPSLKDNRYCLKALTYEGAKKVMTQQERFTEEKIEQVLTYFVHQYSREPKRTIEENLPIIPALLLSVVCDSWEKDMSNFSCMETYEISESINTILEQFLKKTIDKIVNDILKESKEKTKKEDRTSPWHDVQPIEKDNICKEIDNLLFELIDKNGKRERIKATSSRLSQIKFENKYKDTLRDNRIIKVTRIDGEDYVELVHDALCSVILKKKEQRIKEIEDEAKRETERANKLKEQREEFIASFFTIPLALITCVFISKVFQDKDVFINLRAFDTSIIMMIANLSIIPILIYTAIKRFKATLWLSLYGIISNAILLFLSQDNLGKETEIQNGLFAVSIGIPAIALIYASRLKPFGKQPIQELKKIITSIPIVLFIWIIATYVFYLCVFNKTLGNPEPVDSSWGVFVIPLLTYEITRNALGHKLNNFAFITLCCLWGLLTFNTYVVPFALPSFTILGIVVAILLSLIWSYSGLNFYKKIIGVLFNFLILAVVIILNMGFAINKVKYDSVSHVFNWADVIVHNEGEKLGIVSAINGDTILPCHFDSIDFRKKHLCFLNSSKVHFDKDITDYKNRFSYQTSTHSALWQALYKNEAENNIFKYKFNQPDSLREDTLRTYAARVFHETRNANISYLTSGKMYSLNDIESIDTLINVQNRDLTEVLDEMSESATPESSKTLNTSQVTRFYKAFARTFFLCTLKDRLRQKDSIQLFNLPYEMITLYFYDGKFEINTNTNCNLNINDYYKKYIWTYKASDLRNNILDSWYNHANSLLCMDLGINGENYAKKKEERLKKTMNDLQELNKNVEQDSETISQKKSNLPLKGDSLEMLVKNYIKIKQEALDLRNNTYKQAIALVDNIDLEKKEMDKDFQKLINDVFTTLSKVVMYSQNIYNSGFTNICEQLYLISEMRQYEIAPSYLQMLKQMYHVKNPMFDELKEMQEQLDSIKIMARELQTIQ